MRCGTRCAGSPCTGCRIVAPDNRLIGDLSPDIWAPDRHRALARPWLPRLRELPGFTAVLTTTGEDNYWHWMTETLPRYEVLARAGFLPERVDRYLTALHLAEGEYATASVQADYAALSARGDRRALREIPCLFTTGQRLLEGLGLGVPDLMKIDVEGWELPALRGFGPLVSEGRIGTILFEVNPGAQKLAGQEPAGVVHLLQGAGYTISQLSAEGELRAMSDAQCHALLSALGDAGFASLVATSRVSRG